ncbi:uncharacterized sodium-dependent transporter YocR-like [Diadema antillarum]|uniref:uncharacterized sodium-dependent transporter YocR-like n=1 Tax=Diadema antillarum TaxID=105358 RepID=UPI003A83819C
MDEATDTTPLQPQHEPQSGRVNSGGSFRTTFGTILTCIGCMVGTGNIWRFPRILANNSGDQGCLQFMLVWVVFLFIWSIPLILIEYGTGRYTKKATIGAFTELIGPKNGWAGAWVALVDFGISGYYCVIVGWCIYYLIFYIGHDLPESLTASNQTFQDFAVDSDWPLLYHTVAIFLAGLTVLWGVKSIEVVCSVIVSIFLVLVVVCFIWSMTLPDAVSGVRFMFTPDWAQFGNARMWVDAISQNAFDTGAAAGLFVSYSAYMTADHGIVRYGNFIPIGNNLVSLICGMLTYATVFSTQMAENRTQTEIVELLKTNGPANTGLTFIWFPLLFEQIPGGRFFCIIFFIALMFAGLSSLLANIELFVKILEDFGVKRKFATLLCSTALFLLGIGSAINLNFLINQDFVWGFGLLISGLMFLYMVIRFGVRKFRRLMFNEYSNNDWHLYGIFDVLVLVVAPIEAVVLIIWWGVDTIQASLEPGAEPWYQFSPESFMATIVQWVGFLVILIAVNMIFVYCVAPRREQKSLPVTQTHLYFNSREDREPMDKVNSQAYNYSTFDTRESST